MNEFNKIKRGECYWCNFDNAVGSEQVGKRPVIVISNDKCNEFSPTITVIPITNAHKKHMPTHSIVRVSGRTCVALSEQIFTVSKERFGDYIGTCTKDEFEWIEKCLEIQIGLSEKRKRKQRKEDENADR